MFIFGNKAKPQSGDNASGSKTSANEPVLRVKGLKHRYQDESHTRQDIEFEDLQISPGECIAILGRSGAGKSTLMKIVSGMLKVDPGISPECIISIDGNVVLNAEEKLYRPPWDRNVSIVFQHGAGLQKELTVKENILYPLLNSGVPKNDAEIRLMDLAHRFCLHNEEIAINGEGAIGEDKIEEFLGKSVSHLSGGQKQRVALARCLASKEKALYMFDEPFTGQDNPLRQVLVREIRSVIEESRQRDNPPGFLIVTHNQADAMSIADEVVFIGNERDTGNEREVSKVLAKGAPKELYDKPDSIRIAQFIGDPTINIWRGDISDGNIFVHGKPVVRLLGPVSDQEIYLAARPELLEIGPKGCSPDIGYSSPCGLEGESWYQGEETISRIRIQSLSKDEPPLVDVIQMDLSDTEVAERVEKSPEEELWVSIKYDHFHVFNAVDDTRLEVKLGALK